MTDRTRVAGADLTWWDLDRPTNPMTITGVMWLDGGMGHDEVVDLLQQRLVARYPKFASRIVQDDGHAWWESDPTFDARAHVHRVALPGRGGREGLQTWVGQAMSSRIDPERPLWHVDLVEDAGEGAALVVRLHHVLADGISLARVLLELADGHATEPAPRPTGDGVLGAVRRALRAGGHVLGDPEAVWRAVQSGAASAVEVGHLLAMPADPPSVLQGPLGPVKRAAWMEPIALSRVKAVGRALGGTVNDVLITALTLALADHLEEAGTPVDELRTFVPVNLRPVDRPIPVDLGNRFGLVLLGLPLGETDPKACLAEVQRRMNALKASPEAVVTFAILQALAEAPSRIEHALLAFFATKGSLITTNVPGPREPLTLGGRRVTGVLPWVPQSAGIGLGVSILSYDGRVWVGVASDALRVPDPGALVTRFEAAFERLEGA